MSANIDYDDLIRKVNAIMNKNTANTNNTTEGGESKNTPTGPTAAESKSSTSESDTTTTNAKQSNNIDVSTQLSLEYVGSDIWTPPQTTEADLSLSFNGHFYDTHRPLAKRISIYPDYATFEYSDGHLYSTTSGIHKPETIMKNIAAAPVITIVSEFRPGEMPENYMVEPIGEHFGKKEFWRHGFDIVIEGHWHSTTLKALVKSTNKKMLRLSIFNFTAHGLPAFDIADVTENRNLRLEHLSFNTQVTSYTDFYDVIDLLSRYYSNYVSLKIRTTGFCSDLRKLTLTLQKLNQMNNKEEQCQFTVLTSEHVDDQILQWLLSFEFEYVGKTKQRIPSTTSAFEYYDTFNKVSEPFITFAFLSRD